MPKIEPVMAWGLRRRGARDCYVLPPDYTKADAEDHRQGYSQREDFDIVRVRISVVPKAKRKVKK